MTESEPVGSVGEEAFKLFRALSGEGRDDRDVQADHACTTTWCPVCQAVGFVRSNPDALARVAEAAATFTRTLREVVDAALVPQDTT